MKSIDLTEPRLAGGEADVGSIRVDGPNSLYLLLLALLLVTALFAAVAIPLQPAFPSAGPVQAGAVMTYPGRVWEEATPESQGVDSRKLEAAVRWFDERLPKDGVKRLVIARKGRLIWSGSETDVEQGVWSMTKSLSALAMGPLVDAGKCGPDTRVADVLPEMRTTYPEMTLGQLLAMTSGYEAQGDWPPANPSYINGGSTTPFVPKTTPQFPPGTRFSYWDSAMNVYGLAISTLAGESKRELFHRYIADPIGMDPEAWDWGKFTKVGGVVVSGGSGNKGKHFEATARDLARIGHLMLNRGRWGEEQLISEGWIDEITRIQVPADLPLGGPIADLYGERFPFDGRGVYGMGWWVNGIGPDGGRHWQGCPEGTFAALGYNNNVLFVVPEWDLVVVRLGLDGRERRVEREEYADFLARVGQSIVH